MGPSATLLCGRIHDRRTSFLADDVHRLPVPHVGYVRVDLVVRSRVSPLTSLVLLVALKVCMREELVLRVMAMQDEALGDAERRHAVVEMLIRGAVVFGAGDRSGTNRSRRTGLDRLVKPPPFTAPGVEAPHRTVGRRCVMLGDRRNYDGPRASCT